MRSRAVSGTALGSHGVERATVDVYERKAADYRARRPPRRIDRTKAFAARCLPGLPVVDAGCGPGAYLAHLPACAIGVDAATAMLALANTAVPGALFVRADLEALPFADRTVGGAWARKSY